MPKFSFMIASILLIVNHRKLAALTPRESATIQLSPNFNDQQRLA